MQYLQQPAAAPRHHAQPAHQATQSLHHGTSVPFASSSGGGGTSSLLGQHLRTAAAHLTNAPAGPGTFPAPTATHTTTDAFQPSLCELTCLAMLLF